MKDAVRLLAYFVAVVLVGALLAPPLFWAAQWLVGHGWFAFLAQFDFETFFHRALLVAAIVLLWPLLRSVRSGVGWQSEADGRSGPDWRSEPDWRCRIMSGLKLAPNPHWTRDLLAGFLLAAIPLLCCGAIVIALDVYSLRESIKWSRLGQVVASTVAVPVIEETFFRGLVLGILLRSGREKMAMLLTSALFSIIHFLKAPAQTSAVVTWTSGFNSIVHAFAQFSNLMMVAAAFTTLFLIGWILADARIRTRSLWMPVGLHGGWIFASGLFNRIARREMLALPWLGKNLLVGLVPLGVGFITWLLVCWWLKYDRSRKT